MEHDIVVITSNNQTRRIDNSFKGSLSQIKKQIESWDLKPTKILMNQKDWEDIKAWSSE